jgi:hypothetical protein
MSEMQLIYLSLYALCLAKERRLKAKALAITRIQMAGYIPPLRAELWVIPVIAWEYESPPWLRDGKAIIGTETI